VVVIWISLSRAAQNLPHKVLYPIRRALKHEFPYQLHVCPFVINIWCNSVMFSGNTYKELLRLTHLYLWKIVFVVYGADRNCVKHWFC